jgi:CHAD domain-containing protein
VRDVVRAAKDRPLPSFADRRPVSSNTDEISLNSISEPVPAGRWIEGLSADMPLLDALETIFRQRWQGVLHYLPLATESGGQDVEHVHKLRVSSRRLSAVLDVLAEGFPEAPRKRLFRQVEKIRRTCSEARNLDVQRQFLESLLPHASVEDAGAVELLCERTVKRRSRAQKKLSRRLPRLARGLSRAGNELLEALASVKGQRPSGGASYGETGARTLLRELDELWNRAADDLESARTLHQLRIACKHLRYAFEVFMPNLHESFRDDFYPQLEHLQDLLGEVHDAAEATRALRSRRRKWKRRWKRGRWNHGGTSAFHWRELRSGIDAVLLAYAQQAEQARLEFIDLWPGFAGESFRIPVEEMLTRPAAPLSTPEAP